MAICETCGNEYARPFIVSREGESWTFDSIECAASKLAPSCAQCGCRVLGHGLEQDGSVYCCAHCSRRAGHDALVDSA
jgi:hypothetical protein